MSNGRDKLKEWREYLHAAAAVPKDSPDYADAQAAVQEAVLRIRGLMRTANAADRNAAAQDVASAAGTFAAGGAKSVGELVGGAAGGAFGAIAELPPDVLANLGAKLGGRLGLAAKGATPEAYQEASEASPYAAFAGEMAPVVASSLVGLRRPGMVRSAAQRGARYSGPKDFSLSDVVSKIPVRARNARSAGLRPEVAPPPPSVPQSPLQIGQPAIPGRPDLGTLVPAGPTQTAGPAVRTQSPRVETGLAEKQAEMILDMIRGKTPDEVRAILAQLEAIGIQPHTLGLAP